MAPVVGQAFQLGSGTVALVLQHELQRTPGC